MISTGTIRFQAHFIWLLAGLGFLVIFFLYIKPSPNSSKNSLVDDAYHNYGSQSGAAVAASTALLTYNHAYPLSSPIISNGIVNFKLAVIADMDTKSRQQSTDEWRSYLKRGFFSYNPRQETVAVNWDAEDKTELISHYSHKGRGMELSELVVFNGRILTVDDRTGE